MIDFTDNIVSFGKNSPKENSNTDCLVLYQTNQCYQLLEETLLYEGMEAPEFHRCHEEHIADRLSDSKHPLIFVEVRNNLVEVAQTLRWVVPQQTQLVLIGHVDSISVHRQLEELGFYYLFWPADKSEISQLLKQLHNDLQNNSSPLDIRTAMRIAVVSAKGGSGCTMVSCELAHALSRETLQPVILGDHAYHDSNMHIMLGIKDLVRSPINEEGLKHHTLTNMLDPVGVHSQLVRVGRGISYLGFESSDTSPEEMREYTHNMLATQTRDANFIIENYSSAAKFYPHPSWLCPITDCLILVTQPTLSALHNTKSYLARFDEVQQQSEEKTRLILVLNHVTPAGNNIDRKLVEQFLEHPVNIELPYVSRAEEILTSGKRFIDTKTGLTMPFQHLSKLIVGKPARPERTLKARLTQWQERLFPIIARKGPFEPALPPETAPENQPAEEVSGGENQPGTITSIRTNKKSKSQSETTPTLLSE